MTSLFRHIRQSVTLFFLAVLCFCAGSAIARVSTTAPPQIVPVSAGNEGNWGLSFQQEGKPPVANASADYLKQFHARVSVTGTIPRRERFPDGKR